MTNQIAFLQIVFYSFSSFFKLSVPHSPLSCSLRREDIHLLPPRVHQAARTLAVSSGLWLLGGLVHLLHDNNPSVSILPSTLWSHGLTAVAMGSSRHLSLLWLGSSLPTPPGFPPLSSGETVTPSPWLASSAFLPLLFPSAPPDHAHVGLVATAQKVAVSE